jgi:chromosomal replication initiation ATPase DnaA
MTTQKKAFIEWLSAKYSINFKEELRIWKTETVDTDYVNELFDIALMEFGLTRHQLESANRKADIIAVRHYMMYLLADKGWFSLLAISRKFGSRDHSTVIHAKNKIADLLQVNDARTISTKQRFDKYLNTITDATQEKEV